MPVKENEFGIEVDFNGVKWCFRKSTIMAVVRIVRKWIQDENYRGEK